MVGLTFTAHFLDLHGEEREICRDKSVRAKIVLVDFTLIDNLIRIY